MNRSAEDVKANHLTILGPTLGPIYHALYNEVTWLHAKWLEYRKLFGHSSQRIDLLNNSAAFFFRIIQQALWDDTLLHIARLVQPPRSRGKLNLTLRSLGPVIPDPQLSSKVSDLVGKAIIASDFATKWRHRRLAHLDLSLAIDQLAEPLPAVSRKQVEDALSSIRDVMNAVYGQYFNSTVAFEHFISAHDADLLIYRLRVAARVEELEITRFRAGTPFPEDFQPLPEA